MNNQFIKATASQESVIFLVQLRQLQIIDLEAAEQKERTGDYRIEPLVCVSL